jgi:hypothetical protein
MKAALFIVTALLAACAPVKLNVAEWQRNECRKVIDPEDRERCLRRVDLANPPEERGSGPR